MKRTPWLCRTSSSVLLGAAGILLLVLAYSSISSGFARVVEPDVKKKHSESDVPFYTIEKGTKSGVKKAERLAVLDEHEWLGLWRRHRSGNLVSRTVPPVDFEEDMVLAVFQGEGGEEAGFIEIDRIKMLSDKVLVIVKETESDSLPNGTKSTTSSFHMVRTARNQLPVVFQ